MCGRYNFIWDNEIAEMIRLKERMWESFPEYEATQGDIYPSYEMPLLVKGQRNEAKARIALLRWGMEKEGIKGRVINARSESVAQRGMFASSFKNRRCVIFANGFYEFSPEKKPYFYTPQSGGLLYMAGIYDEAGRYVIITKPANELILPIHSRMPALLNAGDIMPYLKDASRGEELFRKEEFQLIARAIS